MISYISFGKLSVDVRKFVVQEKIEFSRLIYHFCICV